MKKECHCENGGTCEELEDQTVCICPEGFNGEYCEQGNIIRIIETVVEYLKKKKKRKQIIIIKV